MHTIFDLSGALSEHDACHWKCSCCFVVSAFEGSRERGMHKDGRNESQMTREVATASHARRRAKNSGGALYYGGTIERNDAVCHLNDEKAARQNGEAGQNSACWHPQQLLRRESLNSGQEVAPALN